MILPGNDCRTLPVIHYEEMEGTVHIKGKSISPEITEYFDMFLEYFKENMTKNPIDLKIIFEIEYYNTKSARVFLNFFNVLKTLKTDIQIIWILEEGDEDLRESIEDYQEMTGLKMSIQEKPE